MSSRRFPDQTVPPGGEGTREPDGHGTEELSGLFSLPQEQRIAVTVADRAYRTRILGALRDTEYLLGGPDTVSSAGVIIADVPFEGAPEVLRLDAIVKARIRDLRRAARSDAAIIVVIDRDWPAPLCASAEAAGAFACIRSIGREGLQAVIRSASANHAAQTRIADLTRQLDLHSHLATLGRFTGGLHHELKNPLAVVEMNVDVIREEFQTLLEARKHLNALLSAPPGERGDHERKARTFLERTEPNVGDLGAALKDTRASLERMRRLFLRLQSIVRQGGQSPERVDIEALLLETRNEAEPFLQGVEVEVVVNEPLHAIAVRSLVHDIVLNLAANAATAARSLSAPRVRFHAYASRKHVVISVRDNGPGIPVGQQEKLFEPFFTTRRAEGAVGLGLAICREYATLMDAELSFWTAPGRGACFRLHLLRA